MTVESHEVIIVGGGPAGSSCAWRLRHHGIDCLVLDAQPFPRLKLCAGWITPEVVRDLELDPASYPHRFLSFEHIHIHIRGLHYRMKDRQHSIRRLEFDHWLLQRSGAPVAVHNVRHIEKRNGHYLIDGRYRARYLVGAGGTRCPVYRSLFREHNPRAKALQAVSLEQEFPYDWQDDGCHLWFFDNGLPGYSWYVPKADGYLNVGVGGMAHKLKARGDDIKRHWQFLTRALADKGLVNDFEFKPGGYSYYLRGDVDVGRVDNAFVIGDAAGLASRDMCEGIGPAVRSGLAAAESIATGAPYSLAHVDRYSIGNGLIHRLLEYMFVKRAA